jgi:hypothetical protein
VTSLSQPIPGEAFPHIPLSGIILSPAKINIYKIHA